MAYNLLLPLYMQAHVAGDQWGIQHRPGSTSLLNDYITVGQRAFAINYNTVGASSVSLPTGGTSPFSPATDSRKKSQLFKYVKGSSWGGGSQGDHCWDDDDICLVFLQTNPTAQAVQKAQVTLYYVLKDLVANLNYVKDAATSTTVAIDVNASWANNWQGYENAVWTSLQTVAYGQVIQDNYCPVGTAAVGVWQIPKASVPVLLCQTIPAYPAWIPGTSTSLWPPPKSPNRGGSLCGVDLQCSGSDFMIGAASGNQITCYHRQDNQTSIPSKGTCSYVDHNYTSMPSTGTFFALPAGGYMTGINMANYNESKKLATYYYCDGQIGSQSLGAPLKMGSVGGASFPNHFNVFTFGNITGLRDVQWPVASDGSVEASSFNINWSNLATGMVSTGFLKLVNGTLRGASFYAAGEKLSGVTYNQSINFASMPLDLATGKAMDFGAARTKLQDLSKKLAGFVANGSTQNSYGNITLKGRNSRLNIFLVGPVELKATHSITIDAPTTSTVIINVSGGDLTLANAGFTTSIVSNRILWNLYEATKFYATSVGIPGSVLAPFADARLGGNIDGTLISETLISTNEFHQSVFEGNWLVP